MVHRDLCGNPKTGKPWVNKIFTIQSGYTTPRGIQHSVECISRTGLFASVVTHTAMARLTHTLSLTRSTSTVLTLFVTVKVCPSCIYTYTTFLAIYTIPILASAESLINSAPLSFPSGGTCFHTSSLLLLL